MAASNVNVSPIEFHRSNYSSQVNTHPSQLDRDSKFGQRPTFERKHAESSKPELKPEWLQPKDASKRKRINRTAKLKQCKLDARREQWLSQGSHSRAKLADENCHDILAHKSNDGRDQDLLRDQGLQCHSDRLVSIQKPESWPSMHAADDRGRVSPRFTAISMVAGDEKQRIAVKWKDLLGPQLPELNYCKNNGIDKSFNSTVVKPEDNESTTLMHSSCLTNTSDPSLWNEHVSPVTLTSESSMIVVGKEADVALSEGSFCRLDEQEMVASNVMSKQEQGSLNFSHSCSSVSVLQLANTCTSSRCSGSSNDDDAYLHHDGEDDWEAVADAIYLQGVMSKSGDTLELGNIDSANLLERKGTLSATLELKNGTLQPGYNYKAGALGGRARGMGSRAWRPDDAARPPTLPRLSKQNSFPLLSTSPAWSELHDNNLWGPPPTPLFCPICTEELDVTDSSFVPCSCGFRLCLFCHHRIAADDGRCPGCRKTYNSDVAMKLSRTSSVWLQI